MRGNKKQDWIGFWVHFFFGAIFGSLVGLWLWARWVSTHLATPDEDISVVAFLFVGGGALLFGLFAGYFRDKFWSS
jgi:hypothetical protein